MIKLDQPYSLGLFQDILESLFGDKGNIFDTSRVVNQKGYWKYITRMDRIGEQSDLEVQFYVVEHRGFSDPRVSLTKEIFKTLRDAGHRKSLVAIYHPNSNTWRLSLVTMILEIDEKNRTVLGYSDARRLSFLLGRGEKVKTPENQIKRTISSFQELFDLFDVEVVRKEFFNNYLDLYIRLYREILKDKTFTDNLKSQQIDLVSFTKTLLGKIVFLYFIQKKGWLGVEDGSFYGKDGDKDFMRTLWNDFTKNDKKTVWEKTGFFYNDYLEHLFYEGLNKDNRDNNDLNDYFNFKVPYLNGGLFKKDYENWNTNRARISNEIFSNSEGTGILDIFDTYNFTIDEDDLYDKEIAVDPEMLGKIFEKMISINFENIDSIVAEYTENESSKKKKKIEIDNVLNKKLGAFYTPREIVHYMTKESLMTYLVNSMKGKKDENEIKVRQLFDLKEQFLITKGEIIESTFDALAYCITEVDELLKRVKILDPAVGSGAFPMGLLHEIATIRYYIYGVFYETFGINTQEYKNEAGKISMYKIKRDVIQNNIFGVDISAGAIEIARLRFWLSLVVDEESPEPLPNFEFKFVCANTLIPLEEEQKQEQLQLEEIQNELNLDTLKNYMSKFYNAQTNKDKDDWKNRIENFLGIKQYSAQALDLYNTKSARTKQLETYEPFNPNHSADFFDSGLMMGNSKFDIVIGNPPYKFLSGKGSPIKELEKNGKYEEARILEKQFNTISLHLKLSSNGCKDLYKWFIEKGFLFLKRGGVLCYITPNTYIAYSQYRDIRGLLFESNKNNVLIDLGFDVFEDPVVPTAIFLSTRDEPRSSQIRYADLKSLKYSDIKGTDFNKLYNDNLEIISMQDSDIKIYKNDLARRIYENGSYSRVGNECIIREGEHCATPNFLNCSKAIDNSSNGTPFVFDGALNNYYNVPIVYLSDYNIDYKDFHDGERLIIRKTGDSIICSLPEDFRYGVAHQNTYILKCNNSGLSIYYIYALFTSKLFTFLYQSGPYGQKGRTLAQFRKYGLDTLPIPKVPSEIQKPLIELINTILKIANQDNYDPKNPPKEQIDLILKINDLVYNIYDLTFDDIALIESSL